MLSKVQRCGRVAFPEWTGERIYMQEFRKGDDLGRWTRTVDAMLDGVDTDGPIYLMVDQSIGQSRRLGVHIDGYWNPMIAGHQGHHRPSSAGHAPNPTHGPVDRPYDKHKPTTRRPNTRPGVHWTDGHNFYTTKTDQSSWGTAKFETPEALILASDVFRSCRAYEGEFKGEIGEGGDCSAIPLEGLRPITLEPGVAYKGNVTMLHESLPFTGLARTLVRLNVPGHHV